MVDLTNINEWKKPNFRKRMWFYSMHNMGRVTEILRTLGRLISGLLAWAFNQIVKIQLSVHLWCVTFCINIILQYRIEESGRSRLKIQVRGNCVCYCHTRADWLAVSPPQLWEEIRTKPWTSSSSKFWIPR